MTIQEILELLNDNGALKKDLLAELVNDEVVNNYLETDAGKKILQPRLDRYHNKSLETWKQNNLEKLMNEEITKRFPNETPEQKRIRELEMKLEKQEADARRKELTIQATELASKSGLPASLIKYFVGSNEEETRANIEMFEAEFKTHLDKSVVERTKGTTPSTPTQLNNSAVDSKSMSFTDFCNMQ